MPEDFYAILGVKKGATDEEIKKAYRKLAHRYHPDKKGGDEARFKKINEAYQVLSDRTKRQQYDQFGSTFDDAARQGRGPGGNAEGGFSQAGFQGFDFSNAGGFSDIFSEIFGQATGRGARTRTERRSRGNDVSIDVTVSFEEAASGTSVSTALRMASKCPECNGNGATPGTPISTCSACGGQGVVREVRQSMFGAMQTERPCSECRGQGKKPEQPCRTCGGDGRTMREKPIEIAVPEGIDDGQTIKLEGAGEAGVFGGTPGDLYITVHVREHRYFKRDGSDIILNVPITYAQAVLGDRMEVPTIHGNVELKIPKGVQHGHTIRLRNKGLRRVGTSSIGDQYVIINIVVNEHPSRREKKILEELAQEEEDLKGQLRNEWR